MTITLNGTTGVTTPGVTDTGALSVAGITTLGALGSSVITSGTAVASTSGTSIDFTGIPSWAKRITVMFAGVSTSSTSNLLVQIGSGSVTTTGYLGAAMNNSNGVSPAIVNFTNGFGINGASAPNTYHGALTICLVTGSTYTASGSFALSSSTNVFNTAGSIALGGTLDRVRITTVNGTDTFDAGSVNILYE